MNAEPTPMKEGTCAYCEREGIVYHYVADRWLCWACYADTGDEPIAARKFSPADVREALRQSSERLRPYFREGGRLSHSATGESEAS